MAMTPVVEVNHAFGSACGKLRRESVAFGDDAGDYLVNPVGRRIAFRRIDTNEMNLVVESEHVESVSAIAISRARGHLAVCETCTSEPLTQVSIYDLRAVGIKPAVTLEELGGAVGRIVCACFSPEEKAKMLCIATASPNCLLVLLEWRENQVIGKCTMSSLPDQLAISPLDTHIVSASGADFIQLWTVAEDNKLEESAPFFGFEGRRSVVDHAWMIPGDGTLAVCTGEGSICVLNSQDMEMVFTIDSPFELGPSSTEKAIAVCIRCYHKGFAVGSTKGNVAIWELAEEGDDEGRFVHVRTVCVRRASASVCCIDIVDGEGDDSGGMKIAFGFSDAQIGHSTMAALVNGADDLAICSIVAGGFHSGPITSLDVAAQRPIIASMCQEESSVRIWNYALRKCELTCTFPGEELTSVAIHPFGFFLAVSFTDKLRFFQILVNELKPYRELSNGYRGIRLVKFSNGGHLLAIAQGKLVLIVSTKTMQKVATLRGHSQHVTSLCFDPHDEVLLSCGEDGSLFQWSTTGWQKAHEHFARSSECLAITAGEEGYSCCSLLDTTPSATRSLLQSKRNCEEDEEEIQLPGDMQIAALCYQTGVEGLPVILAGTSTGMLWICQSPLSLETLDAHGLHAGACSAICLAADGQTVVTAGCDGAMFVLSISGLAAEKEGGRRDKGAATEIVMINRGEIQVRLEEFQQLDAENSTLQARLTEEAARLEGECRSRVEKARKKDQEEIAILRQNYENLQSTATHKERENLRVLKTIEASHMQAADQLEHVYDGKITGEADHYVVVEAALKTLEKRIAVMREDSESQLEQVRLGLLEDIRRQVAEKDTEIQKLKELLAFSQHRFDTMLDQEGMEYDYEIAELKRGNQGELEQQRMIEFKLKKEQDTLLRGLDKMEHDREQISKEQMETKMIIRDMSKQTTELSKDVNAMKGDRRDREAILREKELQIGAYKVKVNTLKKFKHVLDFRLREVTQSLQPKEHMITQLNEDLVNLESEFENQLYMQHQMESELQKKDVEIKDLHAEGEQMEEALRHRQRRIENFHTDLYKLVKEETDVREWPMCIKRIYRDHMNPECIAKEAEQNIPMEELRRQTRLMEKKVTQLGVNKGATELQCRQDIQNKQTENSLLIHELNMLRVHKKTLNRQVKDLMLRVRQAELKALPALEDKDTRSHSSLALGNSPSDPSLVPTLDIFGGRAPSGSGLPPGRPLSGKSFSTTRRIAPTAGPARSTWQHAGGDKKRRPDAHLPPEERRKMQQCLAKADLNQQQIEMQTLENKILRDQVQMIAEKQETTGSILGGTHLAGAAHKAVRQGASR